jgi:hypothetical protein
VAGSRIGVEGKTPITQGPVVIFHKVVHSEHTKDADVVEIISAHGVPNQRSSEFAFDPA